MPGIFGQSRFIEGLGPGIIPQILIALGQGIHYLQIARVPLQGLFQFLDRQVAAAQAP